MLPDPQDPNHPEPTNEPNSEAEPEIAKEENAQPGVKPPAGPSESGDYVSEIRHSLADEEANLRRRTGNLIRRITGSLRWVTGALREPDKRQKISDEVAPEPPAPDAVEKPPTGRLDEEPEISDALLTGRLGEQPPQPIPGELPTGRLSAAATPEVKEDNLLTGRLGKEPKQPPPGDMVTRRLGEAPEPEMPDTLLTGRLGLAPEPEPSEDLLTGRLGKEPKQPPPGDMVTRRLGEAPEPEIPDTLLTGRLGLAPEPEPSEDLLTGRLGKEPKQPPPGDMVTRRLDEAPEPEIPDTLLTGRLGLAPEPEIPDTLLTGRLGEALEPGPSEDLLTGRLGKEPKQPPPGDMVTRRLDEAPEPEIPDTLLTGRLGEAPEPGPSEDLLTGRLGKEPKQPPPGDMVTRRLDEAPEPEIPDTLLTGRLGEAPEPEIPDTLLTGRLGEAPEPGPSEDLLTGRLGKEPKQPPPVDMVTRRLDEAPEPEVPDNLLTGRLGEAPEPEIPDTLLTGRLGLAPEPGPSEDLLTGRLGKEPKQPPPGDMVTRRLGEAPEPEIPDTLLTGRLGLAPEPGPSEDLLTGRLGKEPKQPPPGDMVTRRLDEAPEPEVPDTLLTGRLGLAPEPERPETLLTGRLDQTIEPEIPDTFTTRGLEEAPEQEIPDEFLTGRLGLASEPASEPLPEAPGRPGSMPPDESQPMPLPEIWGDLPDSGSEAIELLEMEEESPPEVKVEPEAVQGDEDSITLLESGALAASEMAEEAAALHDEDWMREIREEAEQEEIETGKTGAETWQEQPAPEQPVQQSSSPLRNFFTGIFGKPGERGKQKEESEISDELFTGRLERSLGTEEEKAPTTAMGEEPFPPPGSLIEERTSGEAGSGEQLPPAAIDMGRPPATVDTSIPEALVPEGEEDFFEGLEVNFGYVSETGKETSGYEIYPEDEALLWGDTAQQSQEPAAPDIPISLEDIWESETDRSGYGSDLRREIWSEAPEPETPTQGPFPAEEPMVPASEDTYAATFLTGEDYLPAMIEEPEEKPDQGELLGTILSSKPETEEGSSIQDLRAIALKDYEEGELDYSSYTYKIDWSDEGITDRTEWEGAQAEQIKIQEEQAEAETRQALSTDWKSWFANRKTSHKILLAEAAIVVIALAAAVPYFLYMILRGPTTPVIEAPPVVVASDMPYPTGVTLPGGWYFPLERSTLINGEWQPRTSEWLQGSELRRVVALPWNPQTEAVIKTFQVGDGVELYLNNNETLKYRVYSIEQVAKTDTGIYSDRDPSLAIILYQGKDPNRWVIICKP